MESSPRAKREVIGLLASAGVGVDGRNPWDITVHNEDFYRRVLAEGVLGAGESYMDGWWDCERLDQFSARILTAHLEEKIRTNWSLITQVALTRLANMQSRSRAASNVHRHYDIGNDLFERMLDSRMMYSCGYWKNAATLDEAQEHKLDLICRKLYLAPGMSVLDIGCGWGGFAQFAAEHYGVKVMGITLSKEQRTLGQERCKGLPVELKLLDYRDLDDTAFDRIVSIGMIEHVGHKNFGTYMKIARRSLKEDGLFLLHTIGSERTSEFSDPWVDKYIFPGAVPPSVKQIAQASEQVFVMEDWHNFGQDYDTTAMAWHSNFVRSWDEIKSRYGERVFRMWSYYLLMAAGTFRIRRSNLWQIVFSKHGMPGGYGCQR